MIEKKAYKLRNFIQHYEWGTKGEDAFIPKLLGITPEDKPYAELWIGAHPRLSSKINIDNELISLNQIIEAYPSEILGAEVANRFDNKLPYLLKVLSAGKALSIQTHPNKSQAEELHRKDSKNYIDDNHKPEIAIVLDRLEALVGFQTPMQIKQNLSDYPILKTFLADETVKKFKDSISNGIENEKALGIIFSTLMLNASNENELQNCIESITEQIMTKESPSKTDRLFLKLKKQYGIDIGLLTIFFLNYLDLSVGEAIFTPAGIPHAYLEGNIVECMANSDNVVRAGLTPKFKDVDTLLDILDYSKTDALLIGNKEKVGIVKYTSPIQEFVIERIELSTDDEFSFNTKNRIEIMLITEGAISLVIEDNNHAFSYSKGDVPLIPALVDQYSIISKSVSTVFRVTVPTSV